MKRLVIFIVAATGIAASSSLLFAQAAQQVKWLRVGSLHSWYSSFGGELETGRTGRETEQLDGLRWDAQFPEQDTEAAKSLWIGTTNYDDPILGRTVPHKVISVGTRTADPIGEFIPVEFRMVGRFDHPTVIVDGEPATEMRLNDVVDMVDPTLKADRMIANKLNTAIGITMTRKLMAFSNQNHDNYFIYEYTFKNTGIIDINGTVSPKTLTGVYFFFQYRYAFGLESFNCNCSWAPSNNITWGRNTMNQVIGADPAAADFEMRAQYSWYGRHSQSPFASLGAPYFNGDGHLAAPQFTGTATLHADTSPSNQNDDLNQPRTTHYTGSDTDPQRGDQFDPTLMSAKYDVMARGHAEPTHAERVGNGFADNFGGDSGGFAQGKGYGPYTLAPGDSIRIVMAEGVAGLSRRQSYDIGAEWLRGLNGEQSTFTMPNGSATNDADVFKDAWVMSGEDSIKQAFRRASLNYENGYDIPLPPPPPSVFEVESGGDRIRLSWADNADSWPNFAGYRIYRAIGQPDTFFTQIAEITKAELQHEYNDLTPQRGFDYYYYIQTFDDGSTNDINPGQPLASSKFYTMTNSPAFLRRPAGESLSEIRVVPNPYHIQAATLQFGREASDRIAFFGLPPECTIRIFTERGDLVNTISHTDGSGDELWNSLTSSGQIITSGLYIAHFETPQGQTVVRKFIVIR